jgi:chemotaxis protein CheD
MSETRVLMLQCGFANSGFLMVDRIGSGIGIILYDPARHVGAGLHVLADRALYSTQASPLMYANTAIPHALAELKKKGGNAPLSVAVAGGASLRMEKTEQVLGTHHIEAIKETLKTNGLQVTLEQTGGNSIRCMVLDIDAGKIKIT